MPYRLLLALLIVPQPIERPTPIVVTPPAGYACRVYQFAERTDSLYFQVDCGRTR